jgi:hypothetical protein
MKIQEIIIINETYNKRFIIRNDFITYNYDLSGYIFEYESQTIDMFDEKYDISIVCDSLCFININIGDISYIFTGNTGIVMQYSTVSYLALRDLITIKKLCGEEIDRNLISLYEKSTHLRSAKLSIPYTNSTISYILNSCVKQFVISDISFLGDFYKSIFDEN